MPVMLLVHDCSSYIWLLHYTYVYKMCWSVAKSYSKVSPIIKKVSSSSPSRMLCPSMCVRDLLVTALFGSWCHSVKMFNFGISHITEGVEWYWEGLCTCSTVSWIIKLDWTILLDVGVYVDFVPDVLFNDLQQKSVAGWTVHNQCP